MADPERKPTVIPLLEHRDLVRPGFSWSGPILSPREIPLHRKVFEAEFTYTQEFALQVFAGIPESVRQDVAVIEDVTKRELGVHVNETVIFENGREIAFEDFSTSVNGSGDELAIESRDSADALNTYVVKGKPVVMGPDPSHPMPKDKLKKYQITRISDDYPEKGMIIWRTHNSGSFSMANLLVFRNFAILANNLGLQRLGKE